MHVFKQWYIYLRLWKKPERGIFNHMIIAKPKPLVLWDYFISRGCEEEISLLLPGTSLQLLPCHLKLAEFYLQKCETWWDKTIHKSPKILSKICSSTLYFLLCNETPALKISLKCNFTSSIVLLLFVLILKLNYYHIIKFLKCTNKVNNKQTNKQKQMATILCCAMIY